MIEIHLPGKIQSRWDANDPALFPNAHSHEKSSKTAGEFSTLFFA